MSALPLVVVGGGFAGVAAAWAAERAGAKVTLVHGAAGSSALYSGIVDGVAPTSEALELCALLGLSVGSALRSVATREGVVRAAWGRDRALLDLDPLNGRTISLLDLARDDWDAPLLAKSLTESAWARRTQSEFKAVRVDGILSSAERRMSSYDVALAFDQQARVAALAEAMRQAEPDAAAWLTPPLLGVHTEAGKQLAAHLSRPVGETSSPPAGVSGARFELRRDALLQRLGVLATRARVVRIVARDAAVSVELAAGPALSASAVVLALGGVAAGGVMLVTSPGKPAGFQLSLEADVALGLDGALVDAGSSLWGPSFTRQGLASLERVGVRVDATARASASLALFAAGDVVAERPRSVLEALSAGARAGLAASRVAA